MSSWVTSLITLAAVAVGAFLSFISTRLTDRNRWEREELLNWDAKRLDAYNEFASAVQNFTNIARRISVGLGFPASSQPLDVETGLPDLAAAGLELNVQWERILLLGSPNTIKAAKIWQEEAYHLEFFARQLRSDPAEFIKSAQDRRAARLRFYSAARADLRIISGDVPADILLPGKWRSHFTPEPRAPTPTPTPEL